MKIRQKEVDLADDDLEESPPNPPIREGTDVAKTDERIRQAEQIGRLQGLSEQQTEMLRSMDARTIHLSRINFLIYGLVLSVVLGTGYSIYSFWELVERTTESQIVLKERLENSSPVVTPALVEIDTIPPASHADSLP